jgi:cell surface protein SprA
MVAQPDTARGPQSPEPVPVTPRLPLSPFGDPFPYGAYSHSVEFDSTADSVYLRESLLGSPFSQPRALSLDEFLELRRQEQLREMWEKKATDYKLDTRAPEPPKDPLERLIGDGTKFEIPIPQNPIFSIFGAPTVSINVNASVNVSAGWQWDNNNLTSINALGSTQSAPFFNQNITVSASGKVGDKLKLSADFDNGRSFDFDNQLKINFGGGPESDDDIIQGVEAGNVQLSTPSTLIGGSQALFGVKSTFKFGPLLLTTIASQKRGERKTVTVSGGSVKNTISIKPYEYAQNHFWLDTAYKRFYDIYYSNPVPAATVEMEPYGIQDIEVYEQVKDGSIPAQFQAIAYADLPPRPETGYSEALRVYPTTPPAGSVQLGSFRKLDLGNGFEYDRQLGTITIKSLQQDKLYAVAYRTKGGQQYGELSNTRGDLAKRAILKLIYMNNMQPSFTTLWARQMKNIYPLNGVRNVDLENSRINITFGVPPDTSEVLKISGSPRLVKILGVDRFNSANEAQPDGEFDIRSPYFFDQAHGEIIFPSTEPFRKLIRKELTVNAEDYVLDAIYDNTREDARRDTKASKYTIGGEIAGAGGSKISLGVIGLAPGSVKVTSNGELLVENQDYRVDQTFGEVTLISPKANSPTGNIVVEYEQNDFFTTAVKTLLGLRADYDLFHKRNLTSKLGMTFMRYSQSIQTDKVQIYSGDEPTTNTMLGFDGSVTYNAKFLTKAIDALPLIDTKEPSTLKLSGEWAMSMPNPNTKASLVASDLGKGAAYIDDFESGAKRQIQLSTSYSYWRPASPPIDPSIGYNDSSRVTNKGQFYWYNRLPAVTPIKEIWTHRDVAIESQKQTVLDLIFNPAERGMYNWNFNYGQGNLGDSLWGGMMRSLSFYTTNLDEENIDYIEITMKVDSAGPNSKMYLDLGQISEDVIPNLTLDTEDGIVGNTQPDDILNEGEDVGIDGLNDEQERQRFGVEDTDPSRDDFKSFDVVGDANPDNYHNYTNVDGMEGNVGQERGPFPDTEDLNGNKGLDLDNTYFRYEINLDPDPTRNPQIVGGGDNPYGWRQYRIPIRTGFTKVGNPSFANVQFARVWFKGSSSVHVRVAEMNLVGSDWRNLTAANDSVRDPKLDIAFVNVEDNADQPDYYTIPPGVQQEQDYYSGVAKNEQSLSIDARNLERGEERGAVRIRPRAFDVFNYKQMKFFLHGGGDMDDAQAPGEPAKVVAFMRFGWDSLNYYEYRVPLLRGWNEYTVNFGDLAAIKQLVPLRTDGNNKTFYAVPGQPGNQFALRGIPSLTRVQFIAFGLENNAYPGALSTTMWVDELRAVSAEDANDWAAVMTADAKLADLGTITYNAQRKNPNFHNLEERFGDRVERTDWAVNSTLQLQKFLPGAMKESSIPFVYNHVERVEKPRYVSESDVEVSAAVHEIEKGTNQTEAQRLADSLRTATQTLVVRDGFSFQNFHLRFPGQGWAVRDIFNRFNFGYTYDQTRERSPLIAQRFGWNWDFLGRYSVDIPQNFDLQPFRKAFEGVPILSFWKDFRVNFLPSQFSANTTVHRDRTTEQLRNIPEPSPVQRNFTATRGAAFNWRMTEGGIINVTTDYTLDTRSSLTHLETDALGRQRSAGEISRDLFFKEGRLFNFGLDNDLQQSIRFNTRPRIPFIPDIDRYITPSAGYNVKYSWQDLLSQLTVPGTGSYTKSAQWTSTATLGLDIRLSSIGNALFGDTPAGRSDSSESALTSILRYLIKIPILDFQNVRVAFTQNNSSKNPGVVGSTGVSNLWGRSLLFRSESPDFGPGTAYQLGLTSDPHGTLSFGLGSKFPFVSVTEHQGIRAPNIYVQDNYAQKNNLNASTDRTLWPGATLNLNWSVDWGYNKNYSITTDADGIVTQSNTIITANVSRTYLSLPSFLFLGLLNNDIEGVVNAYGERKNGVHQPTLTDADIAGDTAKLTRATDAYNKQLTDILSRTFEEQLEAFNWLPGEISRYLPRLNWRFTWNGIEKLPFLKDWAQSVTFRHEYKGQFTRNFRVTDEGNVPESHTVSRGFSPLAQITITGKPDVFKGTFTGSISYNTTTDFSLVTGTNAEVSQELKNELQTQFSYQKRGLNIPIFGLNLKNDVEFALAFSMSRTNRKRFNLVDFLPDGNNDGSTRLSIRPSARYSLSNTVQASAFISYDATIPDAEGSRDIRRSTTKVGVDLRVGISGGR